MDRITRLNEIWAGATTVYDDKRMRLDDHDAIPGDVALGITFFTRHDRFWSRFLTMFDPCDTTHILITSMAMGCEVYDAARIAKTLGLDNIYFYGHDISRKFTHIAAEGIYPTEAVELVTGHENWFTPLPDAPGYSQINHDQLPNVRIVEPSDIRTLNGCFDIIVSNIMNPVPPRFVESLLRCARHAAIEGHFLSGHSFDFKKSYPYFVQKWYLDEVHPNLAGSAIPLVLPPLYDHHPKENPAAEAGLAHPEGVTPSH